MTDHAARYDVANRATLEWMLARPPLMGAFLDTKVSPLTGQDYGPQDGRRGKGWVYGWIQGRGLEALATFARHYRASDPALSARLEDRARPLYRRLSDMLAAQGHGYFLYDRALRPVRPQGDGAVPQTRPAEVHGYTDLFWAKGLIDAAALFDPAALPGHLDFLHRIRAAIAEGRFQMDEQAPLSPAAAAAQPDDFGPRMILLGAAGMLRRAGLGAEALWAGDLIAGVLERYEDPKTGVLRNIPGGDAFNAGHGIEFVGFAFDHLGPDPDPALRDRLARILLASAERAFRGPGIALSVSLATGELLSPYFPWWPLPETIRACALARAAGAAPQAELAALQARADEAFFARYWRGGFAFQTRDRDGPVDYVPATPDLDPGYHTGLSLLAAATA